MNKQNLIIAFITVLFTGLFIAFAKPFVDKEVRSYNYHQTVSDGDFR